jgi:type IV pilus assembly protein PilC
MIFHYKTVNQSGQVVDDSMAASTQKEVADYLKGKGFVVLEIFSEKDWQSKKGGFSISAIRFGGVKLIEKISFARNLATMVRAGLSISESMDILAQDADNPKFKKILEESKYGLESGKTLSSSLAKYPDVFDNSFVNMVKAGEVSGKLVDSLEQISLKLQQDYDLISKVKSAMMYPAVIFCALILVGLTMLIFVVPRIATVFERLRVAIPLPTKILLFMSDIFVAKPLISYPIILILIISAIFFFKSSSGKKTLLYIAHHIPVIKKLANQLDLARFNHAFSLLLKSGLPVVESLDISADVLSNEKVKIAIKGFKKQITEGGTLANSFRSEGKYFPTIMVRMISVGEKTGKLDEILEELAIFYRKETEQSLQTISNLIEPILMFVIGVGIGAMVLAIIGPMYSIVQQLSG